MHWIYRKSDLLGCKLASTPIEAYVDSWSKDSKIYDDVKKYWRMIENLIYLLATRSEISFTVGSLS